MKNILLVEDDPTLSKNITDALKEEEWEVFTVYDGVLAEKMLKKDTYKCIILDVNLPGRNGFEICRDFRKYNTATPVLILTAFSELEDKIQGFDCGADDYLTKPFYMRELLLRVQSLVKRNTAQQSTSQRTKDLVAGDIMIQNATKKVTRQGKEIVLTPREYHILVKLVENKGELVSKRELLKEIWGTTVDVNSNTIEVYINFLRNKIDKPFGKQSIKTKIGFGYYFED